MEPHVQIGKLGAYRWIEPWAEVPDSPGARLGWAHPGLAVTRADQVVTVHPGDPSLLIFDSDGTLLREQPVPVTEAHGIAYVQEGGVERLWIADNGTKRSIEPGFDPEARNRGPQVVKVTLDGQVVQCLDVPEHPSYAGGGGPKYSPTSVAVDETHLGGSGDVWVADGYGQSLVHRYDSAGRYRASIDGEAGSAGRFKTPHAVTIDRRKREPELYVADRANARVQVYDLDGAFKRVVGAGELTSPSAFTFVEGCLVIAELRAKLAVYDEADRLVCTVGVNEAVCTLPGWPNEHDAAGQTGRTSRLEPGKCNSPHGIGADGAGNIYLAEWLVGGRYIKLARE